MKKLLLVPLCLVLIACCENRKKLEQEPPARSELVYASKSVEPCDIYIYKVDGCQYVIARIDTGTAIVHKADCPNPIH